MLRALQDRLTYANVVATLALFLALGGTGAYAVSKITGSDIKKHSLTGRQFKANSIGGRVVKESSLRAVPRAQNAARLAGQPAARFLDSCPQAFAPTIPVGGVCVEVQARPPESYGSAVLDCALTDNRERVGRRLPTQQELMAALAQPQIQLAPGGELTSEVYPSSSKPGAVEVLYIKEENGAVGLTEDVGGAKSFRCVADPMN
ncbi:MAG TPA: hypothetical protein VFS64_00225 [Solirubrobacterales bacterium]|nr:hypothetical protein [Solirubrobacterales bacterium]